MASASDRDLSEAVEYLNESFEGNWSVDDFSVSPVRRMTIEEVADYDDIESWSQWSDGELRDMSAMERRAEFQKYRGKAFSDRAEHWIDTGQFPPIVLADFEDGKAVADGRGRVSVALGMGLPIDAVVITQRDMNPQSEDRQLDTLRSEIIQFMIAGGVDPEGVTVVFYDPLDEEHAKNRRRYAQVIPSELRFEFARATIDLDDRHRLGLVAHEVGHVLAEHYWNDGSEVGADRAVREFLGFTICYDHAWPGKGLQYVCRPGTAAEKAARRRIANL